MIPDAAHAARGTGAAAEGACVSAAGHVVSGQGMREGDAWLRGMEAFVRLRQHEREVTAELLSVARRWAALDGGAWHPDRHAADKSDLLADTCAAIAKAERQP